MPRQCAMQVSLPSLSCLCCKTHIEAARVPGCEPVVREGGRPAGKSSGRGCAGLLAAGVPSSSSTQRRPTHCLEWNSSMARRGAVHWCRCALTCDLGRREWVGDCHITGLGVDAVQGAVHAAGHHLHSVAAAPFVLCQQAGCGIISAARPVLHTWLPSGRQHNAETEDGRFWVHSLCSRAVAQ